MKRRFDSSLINFLKDLKAFHSNSGNSVVSFPSISGRNVNLYKLYKIVAANGGFDKVSLEDKWPLILEELSIPEECANASEVVKQIYQRYLVKYERSRKKDSGEMLPDVDMDFDGPDGDDTKYTTPLYRSRRSEFYSEFRSGFGHEQRAVTAVPTIPPMPPNFSRLYKSLLSGLPNEFDLGLSACLALSLHDNRIPLHPNHFALFLDLLCAHAGIFGDDQTQLSTLYADWRKSDGLRFLNFWSQYVEGEMNEDVNAKDLLYSPVTDRFLETEAYGRPKTMANGDKVDYTLTCKEGFVVEMIASVFRNLAFDACNAVLMASSATLLRFLFLGSRCNYRNVSMLCLDTIARLAPTLTLASLNLMMDCGSALLTSFTRGLINSNDRAQVLVGAEILASLCQNDSNFDELCSFVDSSLCNKLFQYLLVPDIHLVVNCAEAIYQISELGPSPCDIITSSEHNLTMIFSLTTIEAVAFGLDAIINIKVVAQHGAGMPSGPPPVAMNPRFQPRPIMPNNIRPSLQQFVPPKPPHQLAFMYASNWLHTVLEPLPPPPAPPSQHSESLLEVYNEYLAAAPHANNKAVFENFSLFADCLCRVFPFATIKSPPPGRVETARIFGVRKVNAISHAPMVAPPPPLPLMPVMPNNIPQPAVTSHGEVQATVVPQKPLSKQPSEVANGSQNVPVSDGVLHVVGAPTTAADMIDRERGQHELAIVRIENKPVTQNHVNGVSNEQPEQKQNGDHDTNGKGETLDQLLDDDIKVERNGVMSNGIVAKKPKIEETNGKMTPENGTDNHINGFIHSAPTTETTNGFNHTNHRLQPQDSSDTNVTANNNGHHDEASMLSSGDSNSAAVFASDGSESAASIGGGDTSRMSTVSEVDSCRDKRPIVRSSCPSISNNDSRSAAAATNTNASSRMPPESEHSYHQPPKANTPFSNAATPGPSSSQPPAQQQPTLPFLCHWGSCTESFSTFDSLHRHFISSHILTLPSAYGVRSPCLWNGCVWPVARLKWSLLAHAKDFHLTQNGSATANPSRMIHPDAEIPSDAGLRAVLTNFCQTTPFHPPPPGFEGPVTKQLRLAGGLILRNLAKHSANGRRFILRHMHELVPIAFSGIESSSAVLAALDEATRDPSAAVADQ